MSAQMEGLGLVVDKSTISYAKQKLTLLKPVFIGAKIAPPSTIIFLHIPKTAGTNLAFLAEALSKTEGGKVKRVRTPVPPVPGRSPIFITKGWIGGLEHVVNKLKKTPGYYDNFNFIDGHFPFGLHEYIGGKSKQYVTLVTNPVKREVSSANFAYQRGFVGKEGIERYLFESIDNPQTRMLAGLEHMQGDCDKGVLAKAKRNIEAHFLMVGVMEDANAFLQILSSIQGWGAFAFSEAQCTGDKAISKLSEECISALEKRHVFDIELYSWARERWFKWKEEITCTPQALSGEPKILCLLPNFAATKTPVFLSEKEIDEYNKTAQDTLILIQQKRSTLLSEPPSREAKELKEFSEVSELPKSGDGSPPAASGLPGQFQAAVSKFIGPLSSESLPGASFSGVSEGEVPLRFLESISPSSIVGDEMAPEKVSKKAVTPSS